MVAIEYPDALRNPNFRECDLLLLEDQTVKNSFALVFFTTAVLNMNDGTGDLAANLEIQVQYDDI